MYLCVLVGIGKWYTHGKVHVHICVYVLVIMLLHEYVKILYACM
jgi:hypothetical protein